MQIATAFQIPLHFPKLCGLQSTCTYRVFSEDNITQWSTWNYRAEPALHEMLLQSPHRTLDPALADFFYVPVYTSCFLWPVHGWADAPWFGPSGKPDGGPGGDIPPLIMSTLSTHCRYHEATGRWHAAASG